MKITCSENMLDISKKEVKGSPFQLNAKKGKNPHISSLRDKGPEALGTCIGIAKVRNLFLSQKVSELKNVLLCLGGISNHQCLLLLPGSVHQLLRHLQRCLDLEGLERKE